MATRNQVLSLFGATPQQIQEQERLRQSQFLASQRDPFQSAGAAIGVGLGRLFGGESQEVQQARQMQEALEGVDINDPEALRNVAKTVQSFAPNRALQIVDRATQIENQQLTREARELAVEADRYTLSQRQEIDPIKMEGARLANQLTNLRLDQAQGKIDDAEAAKTEEAQIKAETIKWLQGQEANELAKLVELGSVAPEKAAMSWYEAQNKGVSVNEVGPYTLADGETEIIGSMDKQGNLYQLTDSGWKRIPSEGVTQGAPTTSGKGTTIKQGRTVAGQVLKDYNTQFDSLLDQGIFSDSAEEIRAQERTGISDITSKEGKQELFRRAEQIFANNEGITEREALERALQGERVTQPTSTQTTTDTEKDGKPDLGAVTSAT